MMNFEEAEETLKNYNHLIGTDFNGRTISFLLIAPLKEIGVAKLMYNRANEISSEKFYENYSEFEIWVIFDEEGWLVTGIIDKMRLTALLAQMVS